MPVHGRANAQQDVASKAYGEQPGGAEVWHRRRLARHPNRPFKVNENAPIDIHQSARDWGAFLCELIWGRVPFPLICSIGNKPFSDGETIWCEPMSYWFWFCR